MKVTVHGYHAGKAWLCILCWSGTSLYEILDPPLYWLVLNLIESLGFFRHSSKASIMLLVLPIIPSRNSHNF